MLTWAVIAHQAGSVDLSRARSFLAGPEVPIDPRETVVWENISRTVAFLGCQTKPPLSQMVSHWHVEPEGITAFSGHVWLRRAGMHGAESWAAQLASNLGSSLDRESLFGIFTIASLRSHGISRIFADEFGAGLLYAASAGETTVVSNRAALAARLIAPEGREPARDAYGVGWLCFFNHVLDTSTSYSGVRTLRAGEEIHIDPAGKVTIAGARRSAWPDPSELKAEELADLAYEDLAGVIRTIASLHATERVVGLSGGKDSRLVASLILGECVADRFVFQTNGDPTHPDVLVASEIAERFELRHRVSPRTVRIPSEEEYFEAVRSHAYLTSGMLGAAYLRGGAKRLTDEVDVGGMFGETLRSHYAGERRIVDRRDLDWFVRNELAFDPAGILRVEVRRAYLERVSRWVEEQLDAGVSPQDVPDAFYLEHRISRWVGSINEFHRGLLVQPLQSMTAVRWAAAMGPDARKRDSLHFVLMRRASPKIAKLAFAEDAWHPANYANLADGEEYAKAKPRVATAAPPPRGSTWPVVRGCLRDYLGGNPAHPVFELVDDQRVQDALAAPIRLPVSARVSLYNLLGVAIWLAGDENVSRFNDEKRLPPARSEMLRVARTSFAGAPLQRRRRLRAQLVPSFGLRLVRRKLARLPAIRVVARRSARRR